MACVITSSAAALRGYCSNWWPPSSPPSSATHDPCCAAKRTREATICSLLHGVSEEECGVGREGRLRAAAMQQAC
ncbi:unnamed protein product [Sphagnum jensenii]